MNGNLLLLISITITAVFALMAISSLSVTLAANNIINALLQGYRNLDNDAAIQNLTMQRPETPLELYPLSNKGAGDLRACFLPNHELNMTSCEHGDLYNDYKLCQKLLNTLGNCWGTEMLLWDKVHSLPLPTPPSPEQISKVVAETGNLNNMTIAQEKQNATETKQLVCENLQHFVEWQKNHAYRQANYTVLLVIPSMKHLMTAAQWAKGIDYYNNQCKDITVHINP
jgi:hypothetical protein